MPLVLRNTQSAVRLDLPYLRHHGNKALAALQAAHYTLDWVFCGLPMIQQLNHQYRGKDRPTDVLSFPVLDELEPGELPPPVFEGAPLSLGTIIVAPRFIENDYPSPNFSPASLPRGRPRATALPLRPRGIDPLHERILVLFVHSLCHLVGHTHDETDDWAQMQKQERLIWRHLRQPPS